MIKIRSAVLGLGLPLLVGCASLPGRSLGGPPAPGERGYYLANVPSVVQRSYQCGPAALASAFRYWGHEANPQEIGRALMGRGERGVLNFALASHAQQQGFWAQAFSADLPQLQQWVRQDIPPIVMLRTGPWGFPFYHFVVVRGFDESEGILYANTGRAQPQILPVSAFQKRWEPAGNWLLVICPPERVTWELTPVQTAELALLLERSQQWTLAAQRYEEALAWLPDHRGLRFNLANVRLRLGRREEAKAAYRALLAEEPANASYANNLAWMYLEEGDIRQCIRIGEEALRNGAPRRYDLLDTLGLAYRQLHQEEKGRSYLAEALHILPPDKSALQLVILSHYD